jgi:chromosome segregation ATPase
MQSTIYNREQKWYNKKMRGYDNGGEAMAGLLLELRKRIIDRGANGAVGTQNIRHTQKIQTSLPDKNETQEVAEHDNQEKTVKAANREEFLLNQIVEFRERAKQLQELLDSKETEAREYQLLADERKNKADELGELLKDHQEQKDELGDILKDYQQKTDGLAAEVERQIDLLIEKVSVKIQEIENSVRTELQEGREFDEEKTQELKETLAQITEQLGTVATELNTTKVELSDKVHVENVKCYRNISELFKNIEEKIDRLPIVENKLATMKNYMIAAIALSIVNFIMLLISMVINMGFGAI